MSGVDYRHRSSTASIVLIVLTLRGAAAPVFAQPAPAEVVCTEIPGHVEFGGLEVVPARPVVGDDVELRFTVSFAVYSVGGIILLGADPLLAGQISADGRNTNFQFKAVQAGRTKVTLEVTYHTEQQCVDSNGFTYFSADGPDHTAISPSYDVEVAGPCIGDCDRDGEVTVDELLTMVNIALGNFDITSCHTGLDLNGVVRVTEIIRAANQALYGCPSPEQVPTPTPDPLEQEGGWCYESSNCLPCDVYPCRPFATNRAYCCYLARTEGAGAVPFSWCPADLFDPSSGGSCTQCVYPCVAPPTPSPTPTNPPGSCCCGSYSFIDCQLLAQNGSCSGWGDPCATPTPTPAEASHLHPT